MNKDNLAFLKVGAYIYLLMTFTVIVWSLTYGIFVYKDGGSIIFGYLGSILLFLALVLMNNLVIRKIISISILKQFHNILIVTLTTLFFVGMFISPYASKISICP